MSTPSKLTVAGDSVNIGSVSYCVVCVAIGAAAYETVHRVHDYFDWCVSRAKLAAAFALDLFLGTASPAVGARHDIKPAQSLLAAQQSALRQAKRERPQIETSYRRCPSI